MATGGAQGNSAFRRLTVFNGDTDGRCELGRNWWPEGENQPTQSSGTFALYGEGEHAITFVSYRFGSSFPFTTSDWQTILQMKQTNPSNYSDVPPGNGASPILEVQLRNGQMYLESDNVVDPLWSTPVTQGVWTRVALDVRYSNDPNVGSVTMYVDANGDGDATDAGEVSPLIHAATLKTEIDGPRTAIKAGDSIPDHLRVGIYHNQAINCASGCAVDVDNVQVVKGDPG
jgi:Polysaccharide lyase